MASKTKTEFESRLMARFDELKGLYHELYHENTEGFHYLLSVIEKCYN